MRASIKNIILNCVIVLAISFLLLFVYQLYENYNYYSEYSKEELAKFFSMKETILFNLKQSLYVSISQMIVFVPALTILEKVKIKRFSKIVLALVLTVVVTYIYMLSTFKFEF